MSYESCIVNKPDFAFGGIHALLVAISLFMIIPFVWMVLTSLKSSGEVQLPTWLPEHGLHWSNYHDVMDTTNPDINQRGIAFGRYYWNSIFVASWTTFLQVITSSMAAFSFARLRWPGRDKVFLLYLATMMLPGLVMMIPNYQIMIDLGWIDRFAGLIVPAAFSAFGTFLLRQFMLTIPSSLDEAAEIDGASKWRLFWDIILPLARPGIITLAIFTFMGSYLSMFWPLIMLKSDSMYTLPIGMLYFDSSRGQSTHLLMAAVTMSVIPMILVFVVLQKYLVRGIQLGAVKG
jgi:ABC-type glycerol-3-phosphate transport system permease component